MNRPFKQVDVFTSKLGLGNPVAVVLDAQGLSTDQMAAFAAWTNLSETTFVLPPTNAEADYLVRIFTPTEELPFAGHPTIGTCHGWLESGQNPKAAGRIVQQCGAGLISLRQTEAGQDKADQDKADQDTAILSFETPACVRTGPVADDLAAQVLRDVGVSAADVVDMAWVDNGPGWIGIMVRDVETLRNLSPTWNRVEVKVGVAALSPDDNVALEVRAFFFAGGSREDPVTGSLNGSLAQWLLANGTLNAPYVASQGTAMGRDGQVYVTQADDGGVWVGGHAVTGIDGMVAI